ncbi:MAG: hypothetical protein GC180_06490 [Bacteroidetes bacterium]|nr:hypothetical protein [Bacteroidota bacterium]
MKYHLWNRMSILNLFLLFPLILLSQSPVNVTLVRTNDSSFWTLDLSKLPQATSYIIGFDSMDIPDHLNEIADQDPGVLNEYIVPRFVEEFDSFDCLNRQLINHFDSLASSGKSEGKIVGLPGRVHQANPPARGMDSQIRWEWVNEGLNFMDQVNHSERMKYLRVSWDHEYVPTKRLISWFTKGAILPVIWSAQGDSIFAREVMLFSFSPEYMLGMDEMKYPGLESYQLPEAVLAKKNEFLHLFMSKGKDRGALLLYSWDIGKEGGNKCGPCSGAPPSADFLGSIGLRELGSHLYFTAILIKADKRERRMIPMQYRMQQWLFIIHHPAKGFLNCPEVKEYRQMLLKRSQEEEDNLFKMLGDSTALLR